MPGYLIKDTTVEERKKIVEESLGNISADCDGCMSGLAEMYQDYIEGKREIRDINMEFNARYVRGDMDKEERRSCAKEESTKRKERNGLNYLISGKIIPGMVMQEYIMRVRPGVLNRRCRTVILKALTD